MIYWVVVAGEGVSLLRQVMVITVFTLWTFRLNYNFLTSPHGSAGSLGKGAHHEDWRYARFRYLVNNNMTLYWIIAFFGIMLVPTIIVYLGCLPLYHAVAVGTNSVGWLDLLALVFGVGAVGVEALADIQQQSWLKARRERMHTVEATRGVAEPVPDIPETADSTTDLNEWLVYEGMWKYSRHPNYAGEIGVWISFYLFAVASAGLDATWYTISGPVSMILLFQFISIPLQEKRQRTRRGAAYAEYQRRAARIFPFLGCC